jgi:hypothetical protein
LGILTRQENCDALLSKYEKELVKDAIIRGVIEIMQRTVSSFSPKDRARKRSNKHRQSKTGLARTYTIFNVLTGRQKLPAHPRDFNLDLPDCQIIPRWDFHSVLLLMVRSGLLQAKKHNFPYPRGRPIKERLGEERRGNPGYYVDSKLKKIIDECLSDDKILKKINKLILRSDQLLKFIKYSLQTHLYQIQFSENAFRNSNRPAIAQYGIGQVADMDGSWVLVRDLSDQRIDRLAEAYAYRTIQKFRITTGKSLYMLLIISFILNEFSPVRKTITQRNELNK